MERYVVVIGAGTPRVVDLQYEYTRPGREPGTVVTETKASVIADAATEKIGQQIVDALNAAA